jgi:uncharacterized NAD(P)/FAD-binding protein YdhS
LSHGAFSNDPSHFLKWIKGKNIEAGDWDFLPRKWYRDYIHELLMNVVNENEAVQLERITGEATEIEIRDGKAEILVNRQKITSDKVVLAMGNFPPETFQSKIILSIKVLIISRIHGIK